MQMTDRTGCALKMVALASLVTLLLSLVVECVEEPLGIAGGPPLVSPYIAGMCLLVALGILVFYTRRE